MIVITDGESHDSPDLEKVIQQSERDNVTRYAVAVSPVPPVLPLPLPIGCQLAHRGFTIKPRGPQGGTFWAASKLSGPSDGPLLASPSKEQVVHLPLLCLGLST